MTIKPSSSAKPVVALLWRILVYGVYMLILAQIQTLDASAGTDLKFSENTYTEWGQQLSLLLIMGLFIYSAVRYPPWRPMAIIMAGLAGLGLVREYNNFFNDQVFDGAWQLTALIVLIITIWVFLPYRKNLMSNLQRFHPSLSEGFLLTGFLTTVIFSRLFGRGSLWRAIMEDKYFRSVKNAAEESVELLGYSLLLIGVVEFIIMLESSRSAPRYHEQ